MNCGSWSSPKDPGSCARMCKTRMNKMDQNGRSSSIQRFESFESFELMSFKDCRVDILRGLYS